MTETTAAAPAPAGRLSRLAIASLILATAAPLVLCIGNWEFISFDTSESDTLTIIQFAADVVVGLVPLLGAILGIVALASIRRHGTRGRAAAIAAIVFGFVVTFVALPPYFILLFFQYLTVHHVG